jgi:N-acetylhexosamine 1-kinase
VIDLDTVMEGSVLSDFGELVRTATSRSREDEPRLERITFDLRLFEALARSRGAAGSASRRAVCCRWPGPRSG